MTRAEQFAQSKRLEILREALDTGAMRQVGRLLNALNPAEIADLLESLPLTQRAIVWELVDLEDEGGVLVEVNDEVRNSLISSMDSAELVAAASNLDLDDLADLLGELPEAINREVLRSLDLSDRLRLQTVLAPALLVLGALALVVDPAYVAMGVPYDLSLGAGTPGQPFSPFGRHVVRGRAAAGKERP